jgi:hypothetical protein
MKPLLIMAGIGLTVLCWGMYGPVLHRGQEQLGNSRLKPLICVGIAYFIVAIVLPVAVLASQGKLGGDWSFAGISWSLIAGAAGAIGALGITLALSHGGRPVFVMPLVFGGAPVINTLLAMYWTRAYREGVSPVFYAGLILVIAGAATVLTFAPRPHPGSAAQPAPVESISAGSGGPGGRAS